MAKAKPAASPEKVALYAKVVATRPEVQLKGATLPYTALNGNMSSMLTKDGRMALRLPKEERAAFLKKYKTVLCEQYGVVQEEYVVVPEALLARTGELKEFFAVSCDYVGSLKPKPTTRKKKAKG